MAQIDLTQSEADSLIAMEKHSTDGKVHDLPYAGGSIAIELLSPDKRERFLLDISRGRIDLGKVKYQNRARNIVVLVRLDLAGPPHRNPDGEEVESPHIHLYKEGYGDKWAYPVPGSDFSNTSDIWVTLEEFMRYCNITKPPNFERGLFT